jgi:hypothetical protein
MITVEQRVQIPEDRTLRITLPPQAPVGEAEVLVVIHPSVPLGPPTGKTLWDYYGVLADSPNFREDPVEIQRRLRDEWNDRLPA